MHPCVIAIIQGTFQQISSPVIMRTNHITADQCE